MVMSSQNGEILHVKLLKSSCLNGVEGFRQVDGHLCSRRSVLLSSDVMPHTSSQSSYTGWIECTFTQKTKSKARASSCTSARTLDEVGEDMPEMQVCDGTCGQMLLVSQMTKLHCAHLFCQDCKIEGQRTHAQCVPPEADTIIHLANSVHALDSGESTVDAKDDHGDDRRVVFEYESQQAVLWIQPNMTYGELIDLLVPIFSIPDDYKITFTYLAHGSVTGVVESVSTPIETRLATVRFPTSEVVLVTATP
ncbi:hypothetical protein Y032_0090g2400 [Ancylostoma ceylanicum]|nr:hypothetical protein Y032_0090g2400 [Ancylostoma ceylanicum]